MGRGQQALESEFWIIIEVKKLTEEEDKKIQATEEKAAADKVVKDNLAAEKTAKADSLVSKANEAADRLEAANTKTEQLLAKQAATEAEKVLAGTAEAGADEKTDEEKAIESAKSVIEGSGFEDMLDPPEKEKKK
jgi:hypothetical protein